MKMPDDKGRRFGRSVKLNPLLVTVAMIGMCYQPPHLQALTAVFARTRRDAAPAPRPLPPSRDQVLSDAMGSFGRSLEQAIARKGQSTEADAQLATLSRHLDQIEHDNLAEFEQVEKSNTLNARREVEPRSSVVCWPS